MSVEVINGQQTKLSSLPAHWKQTRMRAAVDEYQLEKNDDPNPVVLSLTKEGVKVKTDLSFGKSTENYVGHQIVEEGQFVFTPRDFDATPILCGIGQTRGCISNLYIVFDVAEDFYARFLEYYFWGLKWGYDYFAQLSYGMRFSFNREQFERIPLAWPNLREQKQIVDYLDHETARIDRLIEKKARFIALLKEKLVDAADAMVTGRDDPDRDLQAVDIPWAPMIPKDWGTKRAKYLFQEMNRPVEPVDDIITAFRDGQVCLRSKRRTDGYTFAELEVGYQHIRKGDLVIHTMDAFAGAIGISEDDGKATGEYAVCSPRSEDVNSEYYAYLLRCMARRQYIFILCPSVRERAPRFRFFRFAPVLLPLPPRPEQDQIVERIKKNSARLKSLITTTERSIALLKEKRAALITAAVTGKIDVRSAA